MTQVKIKQIEGFETLDTSSFTQADDGKLFYYDNETGKFITDDTVTHGTVILNCKKSTAGTIQKGTPVYLVGFDNDIHTVEAADASDSNKMPVIGIAAEDLDNTNSRHVTTFGKVVGVDTSSYIVGTNLYMGVTAGEFSSTRPTGANTQIQRIAKVLKSNAISGQILVYNTARTAGLPNLGTDKLWIGDANGIPQEVDKSTIGGGGGGHEIYNGTDVTPLTQRDGLRFTGYLSATDDNINQETIIELDETQLTNFNSTDIIDINGTFKLSLEEDHLYFGNVQGLAEQKTLNEIFGNASKIVGTIFIVGVDNKLQLNVPQGYIIRGNSNGEGVAEPLISGANKTLITDSNGNEVEADLVSFFDLLTATSVTANGVLNTIDLSGTARGILGGWKITDIVVKNTTANVVTINIGSSPGGTNVVNGAEIPANGFIELPIGTTLFSETVEQSLNVSSGNWNSANLTIKISVKKVY